MPQIPEAPIARPINMPEMSPQIAGEGWGAVAKGAEQLSLSMEHAAAVERAIAQADNHKLALKAANDIDDDMNQMTEHFEKRTDYEQFPGALQQYKEGLDEKYSSQYSNDPNLWNAIKTHLDSKYINREHAVKMKGVALMTSDYKIKLDLNLQKQAQAVSDAPNPALAEAAENDGYIALDTAVTDHILTQEEANKKKEGFLKTIDETAVINGIKGNDVARAEQTLKDLKENPEMYSHLTTVEKANLIAHGENHVEILKNKQDRQTGELAVNSSLGALENKYTLSDGTMDYATARKEMGTIDFRKKYGLLDVNGNPNRKLINEADSYLNAKEADEKRGKMDTKTKEAEGVIQAIVNGQYGKANQLLKKSSVLQTEPEGLQLSNAIRISSKRTDEDVSSHQDASQYVKINNMIDSQDDPKKIQDEIINANMKQATKHKLLDRLDTRLAKDINHGMSVGNKFLSSQIAPSKGALLPSIPAETARAAEAQQDLQKWVLDENKKAVDGKRIPLTTDQIYQHAVDIAPHYRMKIDEKVKAMQDSVKSDKPSLWDRITGKPQYNNDDLEFTAKQESKRQGKTVSIDDVKKLLEKKKNASRPTGTVSSSGESAGFTGEPLP